MNIKLNDGFSQVCVWQACIVVNDEDTNKSDQEKIEAFEQLMLHHFKTRVQYLEEIETGPDIDSQGNIVEGTGGRNDLFFAVHHEDIGKFAVPRLAVGIRWIEDVLAIQNYRQRIYPNRIFKYVTWHKEAINFPEEVLNCPDHKKE